MSQLTSILFAPYNFFFGENGLFPSSPSTRNRTKDNQALYFGLPAIVFAVLGLLFLIVGELSAGKSLIHRYEENVEEIRKEKSELHSNLEQELKLSQSSGSHSIQVTPISWFFVTNCRKLSSLKKSCSANSIR